jgi:hypothetical protein
MEFDHVGMKTTEKKEGENWVEESRCWVTSPKDHPYHVEWLRYEPDSWVPKEVREKAHIAFRVDSIDEASKDLRVLIEPWVVGGFVRVGFFEYQDGTVVEFMEYLKGKDTWFPGSE